MGLRQLLIAMLIAVSMALVACGGGPSYRIPASTPLLPFEAPDEEDLVADDDADDGESDEDDEEMEPIPEDPATPDAAAANPCGSEE